MEEEQENHSVVSKLYEVNYYVPILEHGMAETNDLWATRKSTVFK